MEEAEEGGEKVTLSIVMTACGSEKEAARISDRLLKSRAAACVKLSGVKSSYWWKGKVEKSRETMLSALTTKKNVKRVMAEIKKIHSYEAPEILEIPVRKGDEKYLRWVRDVTR